jgi:hypothetical protein
MHEVQGPDFAGLATRAFLKGTAMLALLILLPLFMFAMLPFAYYDPYPYHTHCHDHGYRTVYLVRGDPAPPQGTGTPVRK